MGGGVRNRGRGYNRGKYRNKTCGNSLVRLDSTSASKLGTSEPTHLSVFGAEVPCSFLSNRSSGLVVDGTWRLIISSSSLQLTNPLISLCMKMMAWLDRLVCRSSRYSIAATSSNGTFRHAITFGSQSVLKNCSESSAGAHEASLIDEATRQQNKIFHQRFNIPAVENTVFIVRIWERCQDERVKDPEITRLACKQISSTWGC